MLFREEQRRGSWRLIPTLRATRSPNVYVLSTLTQAGVIVTGIGPGTTAESPMLRSCPYHMPITFIVIVLG